MLFELLCGIRQGCHFKPVSFIDRFIGFCYTSKFKELDKEQNAPQDTEYKNVQKFNDKFSISLTSTCTSCECFERVREKQTSFKNWRRKHFIRFANNSGIFVNNSRFFNILQTQTRQFCKLTDTDGHQAAHNGPPWRVLFLGSDYFALCSLKALVQNRNSTEGRVVDDLEVVVPSDKSAEITKYATEMGLVIHDWPVDVPYGRYDVGVVTSFGKLIPKKIIENIPHGIINVHGSLLPRWRGAAPIAYAIYNGDKVTGITIMKIRPKHFDTGSILMTREVPVSDHMTSLELGHVMAPIGADMVLETLADLVNLENQAVEQPSEGATRAPKITALMGCVDFENQTCADVDRQYRAFSDKVPLIAAYGEIEVKLLDMKLCDVDEEFYSMIQKYFGQSDKNLSPGSIFCNKLTQLLMVKCKDGWVGFGKIIMKSKRGWSILRPADFNVYLKNDKQKIFTVHKMAKLK